MQIRLEGMSGQCHRASRVRRAASLAGIATVAKTQCMEDGGDDHD